MFDGRLTLSLDSVGVFLGDYRISENLGDVFAGSGNTRANQTLDQVAHIGGEPAASGSAVLQEVARRLWGSVLNVDGNHFVAVGSLNVCSTPIPIMQSSRARSRNAFRCRVNESWFRTLQFCLVWTSGG